MEKNSEKIVSWDVASYYPNIILNCGLYPPQIGEVFLDVYGKIVRERLEAKRAGDKVKADSLKICVNGSFGKLGSPYSSLYAPSLLVQTTLTGQLALLQLIEILEIFGIKVISANTDGIVCKCSTEKEDAMIKIIDWWETKTCFKMEREDFLSLYSRDVNNYIAICANGKVKTKGVFATSGLQKNPANEVCVDAVIVYLKSGVPVEQTIRGCTDIRKFVTIRTVKGGAVKDDFYLGKAIRWYYAIGETGTINYKTNGNKVPRSDGAKPCLQLPEEFPSDVNYEWYITEANNLLEDINAITPLSRS